MTSTTATQQNGTVSVETLRDRETGRYFLTVIHVDRDCKVEIVGDEYRTMDAAKSAAWELAQQLKANVLPTRGRARP